MEDEKMISDIYAIYLREILRLWRQKVRLVTMIMMPLLWLGVIGNAFNSVMNLPTQGDFLSFLTPGILVMTMVFTATISGITTVFDREFGFLKEMLVTPIKRESILIGKMLGGVTQAVLQGILILILAIFMGVKFSGAMSIPGMFLTMFLVSIAFVSLGLAVASKITSMEGFQMVMNFMIQPMIFLSGAFYPTTFLPDWLKIMVKINPLTYGVDAMRYFAIGVNEFNIIADLLILLIFSITMILIGGHFFRKS
ncbi:MAG: ABC transporter permease [Thermoplasmata archaeon]|nr:ABC transporter permease [Thermoplasmata archaeon]